MKERHIAQADITIREALERLNMLSGGAMTLVVTDGAGRMVGTLTDGDIRRSLIGGATLDTHVSEVMHRDFEFVREGDSNVADFHRIRSLGIRLLPVIDGEGRVVRVVDLNLTSALLPLSAVIMAGGKGERLRPLTLTTPKPLLEIEGKAIIDYNVEALTRAGIDDVVVTTGYLAEQIEAHFTDPVCGVNVRCVHEEAPLGTIGSLSLVGELRHRDVLVMNSDLITDMSFEEMYLRHVAEAADITVAAIPYTLSVPYAILTTEGERVVALEEKPVYSYYANAGIYIISRRAAAMIPRGLRYDATDLIEKVIGEGLKVTYFPIDGIWIDVGTHSDFRHACDMLKSRRI